MKQSRLFGIVLIVALAVLFFTAVTPAVVSAADIYVGPGETNKTIQAAVNNATAGDTIIVRDGTYHENVGVGVAHLTIRSENGSANCIVNAPDSNDHVFAVTVSYVNISGLKITGATWWNSKAGIYLAGADRCNISGNNATGNWHGIYLYNGCDHNEITNNTANANSGFGIFLHWQSSYNNLTNNTANSNNYHGIRLKEYSNHNNLTNNTANGNTEKGIFLYGLCEHNTLTGNTANDNTKEGIFLEDRCHYNTVVNNTASNNYDGICLLSSSSNNTLDNNTANSNSYCGIYLQSSNDSNLTSNTANSNTNYGIFLDYADSNNLTGNTVKLNENEGIRVFYADDNEITCNWVAYNKQRGFNLSGGSTGNNISLNNIITNGEHNLMTDGYQWDFYNGQFDNVNATKNYWGTSNETRINASIYDYYDDPGNCGIVNFSGFLESHSQCAPIPELATVVLLGVGLLALLGYVRIRRKDKGRGAKRP